MNKMTLITASLALAFGLVLNGCAVGGTFHVANMAKTGSVNSLDFHMASIQHPEEKAVQLERDIQRIQKRG